MKRILRAVLGAIVGLIALAAVIVGFALWRTGAFQSFPPHADSCIDFPLDGESAEDIVIDRARGVAYISALDRLGRSGGQPKTGTVKAVNLTSDPWTVSVAVVGAPADFRPHGLSLFTAADGRQTLMAISHPAGEGHRVEIFDQDDAGAFTHVASVSGPELVKPNDLAAVGPRQFFLVNDTGARNGFERAAEQVFGAGYATLVYFDGTRLRVARDGLAAPGGLNVSTDGTRLFVAETQAKRVRVLTRDANSGALNDEAEISLTGLPDNIDIAADGAAWVTAHGSALGLVRHFIDPSRGSPSVVTRIVRATDGQWRASDVRVSDGRELPAASVAALYSDRLLMGSITAPRILICAAQAAAVPNSR